MIRLANLVLGTMLLLAPAAGLAQNPPEPYEPFDCSSGGGTSSCATGEAGCVPDTAAHAKCADTIAKEIGKAIAAVLKCHCQQAGALLAGQPFDEEGCEGHSPTGKGALDRLDIAIGKLARKGRCTDVQLSYAGALEAVLFGDATVTGSLDQRNGDLFCDSTSGAMISTSDPDDAGFVPTNTDILDCSCKVAKNVTKLATSVLKCQIKMADTFFKGTDFDENRCETAGGGKSALEKYNVAAAKLVQKGGCPACLDVAHQTTLGASVLDQLKASSPLLYPCTESEAVCGASACVDACPNGILAAGTGPCDADAEDGSCSGNAGDNCCTCRKPGQKGAGSSLDVYLKGLNDVIKGNQGKTIADAVPLLPPGCSVVVTLGTTSLQPACTVTSTSNPAHKCEMPRLVLFCGKPQFIPSFTLCPEVPTFHHVEVGMEQGKNTGGKNQAADRDEYLELADMEIDPTIKNPEYTIADAISTPLAAPLQHDTKRCTQGCHGSGVEDRTKLGVHHGGAVIRPYSVDRLQLNGVMAFNLAAVIDSTDPGHPVKAEKALQMPLKDICACIKQYQAEAPFDSANGKIALKLCDALQKYKSESSNVAKKNK